MADLTPSALQTSIARQFYGAKKQMVSYYENLRLVYEVESKMRDLRRDAETEQPKQPEKNDNQQSTPHKNGGKLQTPHEFLTPQTGALGQPVLASERPNLTSGAGNAESQKESSEVNELVVRKEADQAERSLA
jgi:hypothetical protein